MANISERAMQKVAEQRAGNIATLPTAAKAGEIIEAVIIRGDLSKLTPEERAKYYVRVCETVGLNPMTQPFSYIMLSGKLTLYAKKDCTDQLRTIHNVSVTELMESEREGVFIVTAKVANAEGRTDIAKGAVSISGLKNEALANALMKAETKAKRRATLSICGLGFLDESEVVDIPGARQWEEPTQPAPTPTAKQVAPPQSLEPPDPGEIEDDDDDRVVWDDEPQATPDDVLTAAGLPKIGAFAPGKLVSTQLTESAWLADLVTSFSRCADLTELSEIQMEEMAPQKGLVSAQAWKQAEAEVMKAVDRINKQQQTVLDAG